MGSTHESRSRYVQNGGETDVSFRRSLCVFFYDLNFTAQVELDDAFAAIQRRPSGDHPEG